MTQQLSLLLADGSRQGRSRKRDCDTAKQAAKKVDADRQRDVLLRELSGALDGLTPDQLADRTPWIREHISSRLKQMEGWGLVYSQGTRPNQNGNNVKIWFALPEYRRTVDVRVEGDVL